MWLIFILIQAVLFHPSAAEEFIICINQKPQRDCGEQDMLIQCQNGFVNFTSFEFLMKEHPPKKCCTRTEVECTLPDQKLLEKLKRICRNTQTCLIPIDSIEKASIEDDMRCGYGVYFFSQAKLVYSCLQEEARPLPASGDPNTAGTTGGTSIVVTIISVLAVLAVVIAICGVVIYRRRYQKHRSDDKNINAEATGQGQVNIASEDMSDDKKINAGATGQGQENIAQDDDYNTIPADFDDVPNTYQVLGGANCNNEEHRYSKKAFGDSFRYSTIVLDDELEKERNDNSLYDKTYEKKNRNVNRLKDSEYLHNYSHVHEISDDYNKLKSKSNSHSAEKEYSHFESKTVDDYSHLNDKSKIPKTYSDYNHLEINGTPSGPFKRTEGYEKPVPRNAINQSNERTFETHDNYESPVNLKQPETSIRTKDFPTGKLKRVDSYEQQVFKGTEEDKVDTQNDRKDIDSYEIPVKFRQEENIKYTKSKNTENQIKRVGSYEEPVLKVALDGKVGLNKVSNSTNKTTEIYETPVHNRPA